MPIPRHPGRSVFNPVARSSLGTSAISTSSRQTWSLVLIALYSFRDRASFRFLGVRFAKQPERFGYAEVFKESGTQSALSYSPECYQSIPSSGLIGTNSPSIGVTGSEDCLFLNIFTSFLPAAPSSTQSLKPVMMFIHGGEFLYGNGGDPIYDGGNMASRGDVVVVTINYRLGTLGFLALDDGSTNGNYALSDQIAALDWLQANIAAFGGDPNRITLAGQSAGAVSIRALLSSPLAIGKFAAAILQSHEIGPGIGQNYTDYPSIAAEVDMVAKPILVDTGCGNTTSQVACLRALDVATLVSLNISAP
jgi:carboxylesterase type B